VCKWIGDTPEIANKHYLTVTEEHFEMAAATDTQNRDEIWKKMGINGGRNRPPDLPFQEITELRTHEQGPNKWLRAANVAIW
jgi:hypothetical protein